MFIRAIIKQVLVDGFFHGDPHPGNILADPISKQIIFLDLGLVGQLNQQQRVDLLGLIYAIKEVDIPGIGDGLIALGKPTRPFDEAGYPRRHRSPGAPVPDLRQGGRRSGRRSARSCRAVFDNGLRLDSQLTLAIKAVIQAEETARALSFDIDLGEAAVTEARAALLESFTPETDPEADPGQRPPDRQGACPEGAVLGGRGAVSGSTSSTRASSWSRSTPRASRGRSRASADIGRQATVGVIVVGQLIGTAIVMAILLQP